MKTIQIQLKPLTLAEKVAKLEKELAEVKAKVEKLEKGVKP